jgi:hypothetical protein
MVHDDEVTPNDLLEPSEQDEFKFNLHREIQTVLITLNINIDMILRF